MTIALIIVSVVAYLETGLITTLITRKFFTCYDEIIATMSFLYWPYFVVFAILYPIGKLIYKLVNWLDGKNG